MARRSITTLRKFINECEDGSDVFISAIDLSDDAIVQLCGWIQSGTLVPDREETARVYKDVEGVMSGRVILPQNTYRVVKSN